MHDHGEIFKCKLCIKSLDSAFKADYAPTFLKSSHVDFAPGFLWKQASIKLFNISTNHYYAIYQRERRIGKAYV